MLQIGLMVKDPVGFEHWLDWHLPFVDHVFIYDHDSKDLNVSHPKVTIYRHSDINIPIADDGIQRPVYRYLLSKMTSEWVCFIDEDEFLMGDILPFLKRSSADGIRLCRKNFGPHDFDTTPEGNPLYNYRFYSSYSYNPKGIYRRALIQDVMVHHCTVGGRVINSRREPVSHKGRRLSNRKGEPLNVSYENIWINHYRMKSIEDIKRKQQRGILSWTCGERNDWDYRTIYTLSSDFSISSLIKICHPHGMCYMEESGKLINVEF
jgi:hypothetical protein